MSTRKRFIMITAYAGALTTVSIAFMLLTGIMGGCYSTPILGISEVQITYLREVEADARSRAISIDSLKWFTRYDELKKGFECLNEYELLLKHDRGAYPPPSCRIYIVAYHSPIPGGNGYHYYIMELSRFEADILKWLLDADAGIYVSKVIEYQDGYYKISIGSPNKPYIRIYGC